MRESAWIVALLLFLILVAGCDQQFSQELPQDEVEAFTRVCKKRRACRLLGNFVYLLHGEAQRSAPVDAILSRGVVNRVFGFRKLHHHHACIRICCFSIFRDLFPQPKRCWVNRNGVFPWSEENRNRILRTAGLPGP